MQESCDPARLWGMVPPGRHTIYS